MYSFLDIGETSYLVGLGRIVVAYCLGWLIYLFGILVLVLVFRSVERIGLLIIKMFSHLYIEFLVALSALWSVKAQDVSGVVLRGVAHGGGACPQGSTNFELSVDKKRYFFQCHSHLYAFHLFPITPKISSQTLTNLAIVS